MTETDLLAAPVAGDSSPTPKADNDVTSLGLAGMLLPQLRALAGELGIRGTSGMRKGDLIAAIKENQGNGGTAVRRDIDSSEGAERSRIDSSDGAERSRIDTSVNAAPAVESAPTLMDVTSPEPEPTPAPVVASSPAEKVAPVDTAAPAETDRKSEPKQAENKQAETKQGENTNKQRQDRPRRERNNQNQNQNQSNNSQPSNQGNSNNQNNNNGQNRGGSGGGGGDDEDGRGRRGRRFRERGRRRDRDGGVGGGEIRDRDLEIRDDDVLAPVAGILDVLDNYAFVRTSGYLAGPNDVYVSMNLIRKNGLRRGDAITGAVRSAREGEQANQRQKFDPLVRLDTVNGGEVEAARNRPDFQKLTPLYPNERLRLETTQNKLTTRVIDLIMPIGKGQRALIVSPPKAGKTTIMQDIANAIATNNPECYLMVVLVDERPEEVTDMQRSVRGEVIASTFDRPPADHTSVAELAIERAKRLVEMGKDVVVLLDSITRLGRAYNNSSPASGRILSGGVDSTALYPPKRFLGAARNIENGGSLTIVATAMVETGSTGDTVIFEEFKGTGNAELKLDRKIAERRVFPAVDVNPSGTRKDELLLSPDEAAVQHKLRRVLTGLDSHQAIDLLIDRLRKSKSNLEFLMEVSKTTPGALDD